jgi:hypothetical protein
MSSCSSSRTSAKSDTGSGSGGDSDANGQDGSDSGETAGGSDGTSTSGNGSDATSGTSGGSSGGDSCGLAEPNVDALPIGAPCTEHEQCSTGYCYDEAIFNEDGNLVYRFCSVSCTNCGAKKTCADWPKAQNNGQNKCYGLPSYYINHFQLKYKSVCLVGCYKDIDCVGLDPFTKCAGLGIGKNKSYGSPNVCQPPEYVQLGEESFE